MVDEHELIDFPEGLEGLPDEVLDDTAENPNTREEGGRDTVKMALGIVGLAIVTLAFLLSILPVIYAIVKGD